MSLESSTERLLALIDADPERAALDLLGQGADCNVRGERGQTLLIWATERRYLDLVDELVRQGADLEAIDEFGRTALMYAVEDRGVLVPLLIAGANASAVDAHGISVLHYAVLNGDEHTVELLLSEGPEPDARALDWAAYHHRDPYMCEALLEGGADVNSRSEGGDTALMAAVREMWSLVVRYLLSKGADVNARNEAGETALSIALRASSDTKRRDNARIIRMLKRRGATP